MDWLYASALAYLLGSIPFGLILTRQTGGGDLRSIGSGNIGATNVLRTGNKSMAAATLVLDAAKGFLAVWLTARWFPGTAALAALAAVVGHCFPLWLRFKGGKGVATTLGVALGLAWPVGLAYAGVWLAMLAGTRISSLAGMGAVLAAPVAAWLTGRGELVTVLFLIAMLVIWLHRDNIARLRDGTEPRIGAKPQ